jgi:hypothetical protein
MKLKNLTLFLTAFIAILSFGIVMSWGDLYYYGKTIFAWQIEYLSWKKFMFLDYVPPGYYILEIFVNKISGVSLGFAGRVIELFFGSATIFFFYITSDRRIKTFFFLVLLYIFTPLFIISLICGSGQGLVMFPVILGLYFVDKKQYLKASIFFSISIWLKFSFYLIAPGVILYILIYQFQKKNERKSILLSAAIILVSIFIYNYFDNWQDLKWQFLRASSSGLNAGITITIISGIAVIFFTLFQNGLYFFIKFWQAKSFENVYVFALFSSLLFLLFRGPDFYYLYDALMIGSLLIFEKLKFDKININLFILAILLGLSLYIVFPYPRPEKKSNSKKVEEYIGQRYHGGKIAARLDNLSIDFPYEKYDMGVINTNTKWLLKQTEWLVTIDVVPANMLNLGCQFVYEIKIGLNNIYRVRCEK